MNFLDPLRNGFNRILKRDAQQLLPAEPPCPAEFADFKIIEDALISAKEMTQIYMLIHNCVKNSLDEIRNKTPQIAAAAQEFTSQLDRHTDNLLGCVDAINDCERLRKTAIREGSINPKTFNPFLISVTAFYSETFQMLVNNIKIIDFLKPQISFDNITELEPRCLAAFKAGMEISPKLVSLMNKDFSLPVAADAPTQQPH